MHNTHEATSAPNSSEHEREMCVYLPDTCLLLISVGEKNELTTDKLRRKQTAEASWDANAVKDMKAQSRAVWTTTSPRRRRQGHIFKSVLSCVWVCGAKTQG